MTAHTEIAATRIVNRIQTLMQHRHMQWPAPAGDRWARCAAIDTVMDGLLAQVQSTCTLDEFAEAAPDEFDHLHDLVDARMAVVRPATTGAPTPQRRNGRRNRRRRHTPRAA